MLLLTGEKLQLYEIQADVASALHRYKGDPAVAPQRTTRAAMSNATEETTKGYIGWHVFLSRGRGPCKTPSKIKAISPSKIRPDCLKAAPRVVLSASHATDGSQMSSHRRDTARCSLTFVLPRGGNNNRVTPLDTTSNAPLLEKRTQEHVRIGCASRGVRLFPHHGAESEGDVDVLRQSGDHVPVGVPWFRGAAAAAKHEQQGGASAVGSGDSTRIAGDGMGIFPQRRRETHNAGRAEDGGGRSSWLRAARIRIKKKKRHRDALALLRKRPSQGRQGLTVKYQRKFLWH